MEAIWVAAEMRAGAAWAHATLAMAELGGWEAYGKRRSEIQSGEWVPIARRSPIHIQIAWTPWGTLACAMTRAPSPAAALEAVMDL
jgi:hypothetical protein